MNLEEVKSLIDIISETDVTEIEMENAGSKIRIKRGNQNFEFTGSESSQGYIQTENNIPEIDEEDENNNQEEIVAPMVGTFYRAPSPESRPFVEVGDIVNPGETLCIIEAMKLMNEIEVETRGKIVEILIENGEAVEYGEPLFIIEPL